MESDARPPGQLSNKGPMVRNWNRWRHDFLIYMKLTGGKNKPDDEKVAWLKNLIGPVGLEALESVSFDNSDDKENMTIVMQKLGEYFDPPKNEFQERNKFFMRSRKDSETIDAYIEDLKAMAKNCKFHKEQFENRVIDVVILNIRDKNLQRIIFEEKDLDLEKLKIIYKTFELNNSKMKEVPKEIIQEEAKSLEKKPQKKSAAFVPKEVKNPCWRCGEKHPHGFCPAWRSVCCYCKNLHHFSHRCPVARLDSVKISSVANAAPVKPNNSLSPFAIEKDSKPDKGYKNNLNPLPSVDKEKTNPKRETLKSDSLIKNVETLDSGKPKKIENQFSTHSNLGNATLDVTSHSQHPVPQTTSKILPSAPPECLLNLEIQKPPALQLPTRKEEFPTNKNNIPECPEKRESIVSHSPNFHPAPLPQNYQLPREYSPLYPPLPTNYATSVSQYSQNNLESRRGIPPAKPKKKPDECQIS